jgi:hypothetical protein
MRGEWPATPWAKGVGRAKWGEGGTWLADMGHIHMDLFHKNEVDYYDKGFFEQQMKKDVLVDDATQMKTA